VDQKPRRFCLFPCTILIHSNIREFSFIPRESSVCLFPLHHVIHGLPRLFPDIRRRYRLDLPVLQCIPGRSVPLIPSSIASYPDTIFCHLALESIDFIRFTPVHLDCWIGEISALANAASEICPLSHLPLVGSPTLIVFPHFIASVCMRASAP
jgi:hypothetical protein